MTNVATATKTRANTEIRANAVFVYGTLKSDECRGSVPGNYLKDGYELLQGSIKADLYDLGPYPGIVSGDGTVYGEVIIPTNESEMSDLVPALDMIEGYYGEGSNNLYNRRVVLVEVNRNGKLEQIRAITYFYANEDRLKSSAKYIPEGIW